MRDFIVPFAFLLGWSGSELGHGEYTSVVIAFAWAALVFAITVFVRKLAK